MYKSELITGIKELCADIRSLSGKEAIWKDADPRLWPQLSPQFTQHQSSLCKSAKSSEAGRAMCSQHCNHPRPDNDKPCLKNCPFGVREIRIPLLIGSHYLGCISIGAWQGVGQKRGKALSAVNNADKQTLSTLHKTLAPKDDKAARSIIRIVSARLQQLAARHHPHANNITNAPGKDERLDSCLAYIQEHLHLQLRAASVARIVNLSSSRFVHWFKEQTGSPYRQYLQQEVLKRCAHQLLHKQTRILDIALDAGYHSPSTFAAAFKQHYGIQPSAFKRQMMGLG